MYFDIISQASHDGGLAVRKRATRILWACVTQCGDAFPRRADAIIQVGDARWLLAVPPGRWCADRMGQMSCVSREMMLKQRARQRAAAGCEGMHMREMGCAKTNGRAIDDEFVSGANPFSHVNNTQEQFGCRGVL